MGDSANKKAPGAVSVNLTEVQAVLEKITSQESGNQRIRLTFINKSQEVAEPFELLESELVLLLQRAIKAGILSPDFVKNLGAEFEI